MIRLEEGQKSLEKRVEDLRTDTNTRFGELRADMNQRFEDMNRRFDDLRFDLHTITGILVLVLGGLVAQWLVM